MIDDPITPSRRRFPRLLLMFIAVDTVLVAVLIFWLATRDGVTPDAPGTVPKAPEPGAAQ
ncbi:MAG TPA: hypothetical protein VEL07_04840 [Planctomycetota bacterium]|nr:hypothetical protein [Planctomycetota bacterium]